MAPLASCLRAGLASPVDGEAGRRPPQRRVVYVVGGDGFPPARVLAGLQRGGALVATVLVGRHGEPGRAELVARTSALGPVLEVADGDGLARAAAALGDRWSNVPVMALSDDVLVPALRLGERLGWRDAGARPADTARHKYRARALFAAAGLPRPPFALIESPKDIGPALAEVGVSGVLKPVYGACSCWAFRINDPTELEPLVRSSWAEMRADEYVHRSQMAVDPGLVYESYLVGDGGTAELPTTAAWRASSVPAARACSGLPTGSGRGRRSGKPAWCSRWLVRQRRTSRPLSWRYERSTRWAWSAEGSTSRSSKPMTVRC